MSQLKIFVMKIFVPAVLPAALLAVAIGCSNAPIIPEYMIIQPDTLILRAPTADTTVSITHSCTCPFSWNSTVNPPSPWLTFQNYQSGDRMNIPISIDRTKLTSDTSRAIVSIASNSYGDTTIVIEAIK